MPGKKNKLDRQYGWAGWIVPCDLLRGELDARKKELRYEDRAPGEDRDNGWRALLCERAAPIAETSPEAMARRLYDVMHGVSYIVNATHAEAMLMATGALLDRDTDLPTLPGCVTAAEEMAEVHADIYDPAMTKIERKQLAKSLLNFSVGFLYWEDVFVTEAEAAEAVCKALAAAGAAEVQDAELVAA